MLTRSNELCAVKEDTTRTNANNTNTTDKYGKDTDDEVPCIALFSYIIR